MGGSLEFLENVTLETRLSGTSQVFITERRKIPSMFEKNMGREHHKELYGGRKIVKFSNHQISEKFDQFRMLLSSKCGAPHSVEQQCFGSM